MDIIKAKEIIEVNRDIQDKVKMCYYQDLKESDEMLNIDYIRDMIRLNSDAYFFEFPIKVNEIGALACSYKGRHYIILNTSLTRGEKNFHLVHDYYHIAHEHSNQLAELYCEYIHKGDLYQNPIMKTHNDVIERSASYYATLVLLPEVGVKKIYDRNAKIFNNNLLPIVCSIMSYYEAPFTMVVLRLFELEIVTEVEFEKIINLSKNEIQKIFKNYGIDSHVIQASTENSVDATENSYLNTHKKHGEIEFVNYAIDKFVALIDKHFIMDGENNGK